MKGARLSKSLINRITLDPNICNGKPVIRGMRITVSTILSYLAAGETAENILNAYPVLEPEDIQACLEYAKRVSDKTIITHDFQTS